MNNEKNQVTNKNYTKSKQLRNKNHKLPTKSSSFLRISNISSYPPILVGSTTSSSVVGAVVRQESKIHTKSSDK